MLEFLILGLVPGTHIQIDFNEVVLAATALLCVYEVYILINAARFYRTMLLETLITKKA